MLIEEIRNQLAGGMAPIDFNPSIREVGIKVDQVTNDAIAIECFSDDKCNDFYVPYENVKVEFSKSRQKYFCVLPAKVLSLDKQKGVWQVSSMTDQGITWTKIGTQGAWLYREKLYDLLGDLPGYYYEQGKLWFENYNPGVNADNLLVKLIIDRAVFDDEDDYKITPNLERLVVDKVFEMFSPNVARK